MVDARNHLLGSVVEAGLREEKKYHREKQSKNTKPQKPVRIYSITVLINQWEKRDL